MAQKRTKNRELVLGYIENISSKIFSDYSREITELADKRHGVYALYKGSRLYYVGLATNLRSRVSRHLKDRHSGKWDKFSLYLVRKADHIKELESLILRIADPAGNSTKGRLRHAENLKKKLEKRIKTTQQAELSKLLGAQGLGSKSKKVTRKKKPSNTDAKAALAPYISSRFIIKAQYKGKTYKARVRSNGLINVNGDLYNSPSAAAKSIVDRGGINGWRFWAYKNENNEWVSLNNLKH